MKPSRILTTYAVRRGDRDRVRVQLGADSWSVQLDFVFLVAEEAGDHLAAAAAMEVGSVCSGAEGVLVELFGGAEVGVFDNAYFGLAGVANRRRPRSAGRPTASGHRTRE
jgi:hypothetical protein